MFMEEPNRTWNCNERAWVRFRFANATCLLQPEIDRRWDREVSAKVEDLFHLKENEKKQQIFSTSRRIFSILFLFLLSFVFTVRYKDPSLLSCHRAAVTFMPQLRVFYAACTPSGIRTVMRQSCLHRERKILRISSSFPKTLRLSSAILPAANAIPLPQLAPLFNRRQSPLLLPAATRLSLPLPPSCWTYICI